MKKYTRFVFVLFIIAVFWPGSVRAQGSVFPLPAPLYILTSEHQILHVDPQTGEQTVISPQGQTVADFDVAPDGEWYAYRTLDNGAVIVSEMRTGSGFVAEFGDSPPVAGGPAKTIAWSPDAGALAYIMRDGVRIAEMGAGDYGEALFSTIQGPWTEMYWADNATLIASDAVGNTWRITGTYEQWTVEAVSGIPMREQPPVLSYLAAEGIVLDNQTVIPRTAGTLAYEWGPLPPPLVAGRVMENDLYFLAADAQGIAQVWQLPRSGGPARALTAENVDVIAYAVAPNQREIAYMVADKLIVTDLNGANRRLVATLQPDHMPPSATWNPAGTELAFHDGRGVWAVYADGTRPQRALIANQHPANPLEVKVYFDPRWSPDGARLLVGIGLWEGSLSGIVDVMTGGVTELNMVAGGQSRWTLDGRVVAWASAFYGPQTPGLLLIDPAAPGAAPVPALETGTPVVAVYQRAAGDWFALVATTGTIGPQYLNVLGATTPAGPYMAVSGNTAGGFVSLPQLFVPETSGPIRVAGLRGMVYSDTGRASGDLVILDMSTGETVQIQTGGPVWNVTWGQ